MRKIINIITGFFSKKKPVTHEEWIEFLVENENWHPDQSF